VRIRATVRTRCCRPRHVQRRDIRSSNSGDESHARAPSATNRDPPRRRRASVGRSAPRARRRVTSPSVVAADRPHVRRDLPGCRRRYPRRWCNREVLDRGLPCLRDLSGVMRAGRDDAAHDAGWAPAVSQRARSAAQVLWVGDSRRALRGTRPARRARLDRWWLDRAAPRRRPCGTRSRRGSSAPLGDTLGDGRPVASRSSASSVRSADRPRCDPHRARRRRRPRRHQLVHRRRPSTRFAAHAGAPTSALRRGVPVPDRAGPACPRASHRGPASSARMRSASCVSCVLTGAFALLDQGVDLASRLPSRRRLEPQRAANSRTVTSSCGGPPRSASSTALLGITG